MTKENAKLPEIISELLDVIKFIEHVSACIHGLRDETLIYKTVKELFIASKRYRTVMMLLDDARAVLRVVESSIDNDGMRLAEKIGKFSMNSFTIPLENSSILRRVIEQEETLQIKMPDLIQEIVPVPVLSLIMKAVGIKRSNTIITPIKKNDEVIGLFSMNGPHLDEHFTSSVKNLAHHISAAIALADEYKKVVQSHEEIRKTSADYLSITELTGDAIVKAELDGKLQYVNSCMCQLVGMHEREIVGRSLFEFICPDDRKITKSYTLLSAQEKDVIRGIVNRVESKDGIRTIEWNIAPLMSNDGKPNGFQATGRDISERKMIDDSIVEEKYFAESLIETAQAIIVVLDVNGRIVRINPYMEEITGYSLESVKGKDWFETFVPEKDHSKIREIFEQTVTNVKTRGNINAILTKDGRELLIEWYDKTLRSIRGEIIGILAIGQDVTERILMERAIKESEEKYRAVVEQAHDGIVILQDGIIRFASPRFMSMLGYEPGEVEGLGIAHFVSEKHLESIQERYRKRMAGENLSRIFETELLRKDGKTISVELNGGLVRYGGKDADLKVIRDCTERKQVELQRAGALEALSQSEERHRVLFEESRDAIMTLEPPLWKFTKGNRATLGMFEIKTEKEFLSYTPGELSPANQPDGRSSSEKAKEMIATALRDGSNFFEWTHKRVNGEEFPATVLLSRVEQAGKVYLQATVRDISEKKRVENENMLLQEQLRQSEKLRAIGQLAGGIAHDFNNMLGAITGYAELIDETNRNDNGAEIDVLLARRISIIRRASERAADLVSKLLAFSRRGKYRSEKLDMRDIVDEVVCLLESSVDKKIVIKTKMTAHTHSILADHSQIMNALLNIAKNGCDAMTEGGTLTISTDTITVSDNNSIMDLQPAEYLTVSIRDTGVGIDKQILPHIFEPFFSTKEVGQGTGLGLASAYGALKTHKGGISVWSKVGQGSVFTIYIPVSVNESEAVQPEIDKVIVNGTGTVAIVDDEEMVRELASEMLQRCGYKVFVFESGKKAIDWYAKNKCTADLFVLDMIMPLMNGTECFTRLKEINPEVKAVIISGFSINDRVQKALDNGVRDFISKPFSIETLSQVAAKAIKL